MKDKGEHQYKGMTKYEYEAYAAEYRGSTTKPTDMPAQENGCSS
jgi:hypothetical protein